MKKTLSFVLLAAMIISLGLCSAVSAWAEESLPLPEASEEARLFGTGYVGQVSEINGYFVTVTLGSFGGFANIPEGELPEMPGADMQPPFGDMQFPQGGGQFPADGMQPPAGDMQPPFGNEGMPGNGRGRGGFAAEFADAEADMPFGGMNFVPGEDSMSFDLENVLISRQSENGTEDCAFGDIALGAVLVIETDENDKALSVLIIDQPEDGDTPFKKPEPAL